MSDREYKALLSGKIITNNTIHSKKGYLTTSKGFCFFQENPEEAIHWLAGIVDLDWCVTLEIDDRLLARTEAKYADSEKMDYTKPLDIHDKINYKIRKEYCRFWYCLEIVKIIDATERYRNLYPSKEEQRRFMKELLRRGIL